MLSLGFRDITLGVPTFSRLIDTTDLLNIYNSYCQDNSVQNNGTNCSDARAATAPLRTSVKKRSKTKQFGNTKKAKDWK